MPDGGGGNNAGGGGGGGGGGGRRRGKKCREDDGSPCKPPSEAKDEGGTDMKLLGIVIGTLVGIIVVCWVGHKVRDLLTALKRKRNTSSKS